jgi:hypothetical protein
LRTYRYVFYSLAVSSQYRIVLTRDYNWRRLVREVAERGDEPVLIIGVGARARRLLDRLAREMPGVMRSLHVSEDGEHEAFVNFHAADWLNVPKDGMYWISKTRGRPPVVNRWARPARRS